MRGFSPCFLCSSFAALVGSKRYGLNLYGDAMSRRLRIFRLRIVEYIFIYIYILYICIYKTMNEKRDFFHIDALCVLVVAISC